ncbi:MAG TPA: hypothetical protein VFB12_13420 [Ktedonobacteraceae bacterium]|nr:hypothetical protein [Ktedonobacteraceae bacterium]
MEANKLTVGDRVYVVCYGPFRGLRGTIRKVHSIDKLEENETDFLFYQVDLEGAYIREPVWFQNEEVLPLVENSIGRAF